MWYMNSQHEHIYLLTLLCSCVYIMCAYVVLCGGETGSVTQATKRAFILGLSEPTQGDIVGWSSKIPLHTKPVFPWLCDPPTLIHIHGQWARKWCVCMCNMFPYSQADKYTKKDYNNWTTTTNNWCTDAFSHDLSITPCTGTHTAKFISKTHLWLQLSLTQHNDAVSHIIYLMLNNHPFLVCFLGWRPKDVLPVVSLTRPYAPLNHVVLSPCCASTSNYNHDGRHQMMCSTVEFISIMLY